MFNFLLGLWCEILFGGTTLAFKVFYFTKYYFYYLILLLLILILSCLYVNQKYEIATKTKEIIELKNLLWEDYNRTLR